MNEFFIKFKKQWMLYAINITAVGIVISYQACSPQKYSLELQSVGLPPKCKTGDCKTGQINPELDLHRPPPLKCSLWWIIQERWNFHKSI